MEAEILVLLPDLQIGLECVQKLVCAFLKTDDVGIRLQNHFYYGLMAYLHIVPFEPHIIRQYAQIGELFYYRKVLQFPAKVFEVVVVGVELVLEIRVR